MGLPPRAALPPMLDAHQITQLHDQATLRWHQDEPLPGPITFAHSQVPDTAQPLNHLLESALAHHRANFDLWHDEDKAREPDFSDDSAATVKHNIDKLNQTRN